MGCDALLFDSYCQCLSIALHDYDKMDRVKVQVEAKDLAMRSRGEITWSPALTIGGGD